MRRTGTLAFASLTAVLALAPTSCSSFGHIAPTQHLVVTLDPGQTLGTADQPLPLALSAPASFTANVTAFNADGTPATTFNGYARISVVPGSIQALSGTGVEGRNVLLTNGVSPDFTASVVGAYGSARLVASDLGYIPADPLRQPPPQCADGADNNNNDKIDFPADPGCAFANDDTEDGGTYAEGSSLPITFVLPRIADVRGVSQGGAATSFPNQQVQIDTGWRDDANAFSFTSVVIRISSDGFYASDVCDTSPVTGDPITTQTNTTEQQKYCPAGYVPRGYASVFAYNFSSPPGMRVCDRLKSMGGTSSDFFGFTEINYPTWTLEEWDPSSRPCLVPEPTSLSPRNLNALQTNIAALSRLETANDTTVRIAAHFGPDNVPVVAGVYVPGPNASNCDFNADGKIDFDPGPEDDCSTACSADNECSEFSAFKTQNEFQMILSSVSNPQLFGRIQADGSTAATFDPVGSRGNYVRSFTGTMRYFSGGSQFTVEARCADDVVTYGTACATDNDCSGGLCRKSVNGTYCATSCAGTGICQQQTALTAATANLAFSCENGVDVSGAAVSVCEPQPLPSDKACVFPRTQIDPNVSN